MKKKIAALVLSISVTVFALSYAVTVWAMNGDCCGLCGM